MNPLKQKIIEKIKKEGPITFESFMEMALYYPGLGYYMKDARGIGRAGDFYTSPHLHPIFGAMLGRQIEEMWSFMGNPSDFHIVEMGAGAGYLCKDMLDYLRKRKFFKSLIYTIVELNPVVQARQKELLGDFIDKVNWVNSLKDLGQIRGCFLSNELLDAFPVHLIEMGNELEEIYISANGDSLIEVKGRPSNSSIADYFRDFSIELKKGHRTEVNLKIKDWLSVVTDALSEGFIFTVDYGYPAWEYYSDERVGGTLLCYHKHKLNENPYENIGEQDITAHVNFSSLKKWGEELGIECRCDSRTDSYRPGLKTAGYCSQGTFLIALGIDKIITELYGNSPEYLFEVAKIKGLLLPQGMGESHKVMIQYKGEGSPELSGFSMRNQAGAL
ncbi:MAG: SAM-dependent methyltransferase [Nitrospirae bacterium]|nr:SAM-dependent methyltransferase [Nitrospirota bacterium]